MQDLKSCYIGDLIFYIIDFYAILSETRNTKYVGLQILFASEVLCTETNLFEIVLSAISSTIISGVRKIQIFL